MVWSRDTASGTQRISNSDELLGRVSAELGCINKNIMFPTKEVRLPLHYRAAVTGFELAVVTRAIIQQQGG